MLKPQILTQRRKGAETAKVDPEIAIQERGGFVVWMVFHLVALAAKFVSLRVKS